MSRGTLVLCLDNLGDLVFASSLVAPLQARFPGEPVGLWCKEYAAGLAPLIAGLDKVFVSDPFWDVAPGRPKGSLMTVVRTAFDARREGYERALLVSQASWAAAAAAAAGIPARVGFSRRGNRRWLTHALAPEDRGGPVLLELARLLEPLGIKGVELRCVLDPSPLAARRAAMAAKAGGKPLAALHPFAGAPERCVRLPVWLELGEKLSARGLGLIWIGTSSELKNLKELAGERGDWRYLDALGDGSVADAAAAISLAKLFVGHDSGPLHVASALGVPCVGLYTPGEPKRTFPQGRGAWRMLARPSAEAVTAAEIDSEIGRLPFILSKPV